MYMNFLPQGASGCYAGVSTSARWSLTIRDATWNAPSMQGVNNKSSCKRRWKIPGPRPCYITALSAGSVVKLLLMKSGKPVFFARCEAQWLASTYCSSLKNVGHEVGRKERRWQQSDDGWSRGLWSRDPWCDPPIRPFVMM